MRPFPSAPELCKGLVVDALLSFHEADQVVWIFRTAGLVGTEHSNLFSSPDVLRSAIAKGRRFGPNPRPADPAAPSADSLLPNAARGGHELHRRWCCFCNVCNLSRIQRNRPAGILAQGGLPARASAGCESKPMGEWKNKQFGSVVRMEV